MSELKMLENDLVPVYETDTGEKVVYGTELHKILGVGRDFTTCLKGRISDCEAVENEDYQAFPPNGGKPPQTFPQNGGKPIGGRPRHEYIIKLDTAKEMAMLERSQKGKQVRRYFIQVEKKYAAAKEAVAKQNAKIEEILEQQSERIGELERRLEARTISENPFLPGVDNRARLKKLDKMVTRIAHLRKASKMRILHLMYRTIEEENGISLDAYRSVFGNETGQGEDVGMLHVIVGYEWLYETAISMCEEAIERYEIFGGRKNNQ